LILIVVGIILIITVSLFVMNIFPLSKGSKTLAPTPTQVEKPVETTLVTRPLEQTQLSTVVEVSKRVTVTPTTAQTTTTVATEAKTEAALKTLITATTSPIVKPSINVVYHSEEGVRYDVVEIMFNITRNKLFKSVQFK